MVHLLQVLSDWGFGRQLNQVQSLVRDYLIENDKPHLFKNGTPVRKCYQGFKSRWHSELSERTATNIAPLRAASCTPEIISRYFAILKKTFWFSEIGLGKAMHLWNCDETSFNGDKGFQ